GGVARVHVVSWKLPDALLLEVFTNEGTGTLLVDDIGALTPAEQASAGERTCGGAGRGCLSRCAGDATPPARTTASGSGWAPTTCAGPSRTLRCPRTRHGPARR